MQQAVLDDIELQLPYCTDYPLFPLMLAEKLRYPLISKLLQALFKLLGPHGICVDDLPEDFRRKTRNPVEHYLFSLCKGISDLEVACIVEANYISWICFLDDIFFLCQKTAWTPEFEIL